MTETQYRQKSVRQALNTIYEKIPEGNHSRRLDSLAALISGIVGAKSCQLSHCASKCAGETKTASRERSLERCVGNKWIDTTTYYLPCIIVQVIAKIVALARERGMPLYIIIESTKSGSCTTWLFSLVWKKRSIPLCWRVLKQKKGHAPHQVKRLWLPQNALERPRKNSPPVHRCCPCVSLDSLARQKRPPRPVLSDVLASWRPIGLELFSLRLRTPSGISPFGHRKTASLIYRGFLNIQKTFFN